MHFHARPRQQPVLQKGLEGWLLTLVENPDDNVNGELLATNSADPDDINTFPAINMAKRGQWFRLEIIAKDATDVLVDGRKFITLLHADNVPRAFFVCSTQVPRTSRARLRRASRFARSKSRSCRSLLNLPANTPSPLTANRHTS